MMDRKPRFYFRELYDNSIELLKGNSNSMEDVLEITISLLLDTREPHRSGRIVKTLDWFMFLGDVVFDKHDLDPNSYNMTIF